MFCLWKWAASANMCGCLGTGMGHLMDWLRTPCDEKDFRQIRRLDLAPRITVIPSFYLTPRAQRSGRVVTTPPCVFLRLALSLWCLSLSVSGKPLREDPALSHLRPQYHPGGCGSEQGLEKRGRRMNNMVYGLSWGWQKPLG